MAHFVRKRLDQFDSTIAHWSAQHSIALLRIGLGIVYLWFGVLKFFPGQSSAEDLAARTMDTLTFGLVPDAAAMPMLALLECAIGLGFLTGRFMRFTLLLMAFQMVGALSPLILFPGDVFSGDLYAPTLEGQYIIKNLVLIGGALVIGATVRGGRLVANPQRDGDERRSYAGRSIQQPV
ncbi:MAG: DoxX family protein [Dehalococcoidia bacterium]